MITENQAERLIAQLVRIGNLMEEKLEKDNNPSIRVNEEDCFGKPMQPLVKRNDL